VLVNNKNMNTRFTIAGRMSLFLVVLAILASVAVGSFLVYQEYLTRKDALVNNVIAKARQGAQQQFSLSFRGEPVMAELLANFPDIARSSVRRHLRCRRPIHYESLRRQHRQLSLCRFLLLAR